MHLLHPNHIAYWLPRLNYSGVRTPQTVLIATPFCLDLLADQEGLAKIGKHELDSLVRVFDAVSGEVMPDGGACFMRLAGASAKHEWSQTCHVTSRDSFMGNLRRMVSHLLEVANQDLTGNTIALREMIPTTPAFHAFRGEMPITREYRVFARNVRIKKKCTRPARGEAKLKAIEEAMFADDPKNWPAEVTHVQAYWPDEAFEMDWIAGDIPSDWRDRLEQMNAITPGEFECITAIAKQAISGFVYDEREWSIDILQDSNGGWWVTDMALGETSHRHEAIAPTSATEASA